MQGEPAERDARHDLLTVAAIAVVLLYAAAAGYRTLGDSDLPWQLRDARYLIAKGRIASHDVFSYTAAGQPSKQILWLHCHYSICSEYSSNIEEVLLRREHYIINKID